MGGMNLSTGYLLGCMRSKFLRRKRILTLIFLGMLIAALGVIFIASVALFGSGTPFTVSMIWAQIRTGFIGLAIQAVIVPLAVIGIGKLLEREAK